MNALDTKTRKSFFSRLGNVCMGVIAPSELPLPAVFRNPCPDRLFYEATIAEIQRFRGRVYLEDGAIAASALDGQQRHFSDWDYRSWHLFILDPQTEICGCMRITSFRPLHHSELKLFELIQRMDAARGGRYAAALQSILNDNQALGLKTSEIGGWAVTETLRNTSKAMLLASAVWSLAQIVGRHVGFASATQRNRSAEILRRLGGSRLRHQGVELPPFFDGAYGCDMEILTFDSEKPAPEYEPTVVDLRDFLVNALVLSSQPSSNDPAQEPAGLA
jgi:hypothetical protein